MHGAPAYLGEMSPAAIRGLLVSLKEAFIVIGMLFGFLIVGLFMLSIGCEKMVKIKFNLFLNDVGYTVGYINDGTEGGWRMTFLSSIFFSITMLGGAYYLPPSARWLMMRGNRAEARRSLRFVDPHIPESELEAIQDSIDMDIRSTVETSSSTSSISISDMWRDQNVRPALIAGLGVVALQQVTGQPSVLYYADSIFEDVGMDMMASIGV